MLNVFGEQEDKAHSVTKTVKHVILQFKIINFLPAF